MLCLDLVSFDVGTLIVKNSLDYQCRPVFVGLSHSFSFEPLIDYF